MTDVPGTQVARIFAEMEQRYDSRFKVVFEAIRELTAPERTIRRRIGFGAQDRK